MSDDGPRFEDTMDALEEQREATEKQFNDLLTQLTGYIAEVRETTDRTTALYEAQVAARREALAAVKDSLSDAVEEGDFDDTRWPEGSGLRGRVNKFARWLLRDYLMVIDRRRDVHTSRIEHLKVRVDSLQETVAEGSESAQALNEALGQVHQALQSALATHREMLTLVNAKDAEVLQRAVAGPLRRMELLFDEFGRQQEALLSQLVGRRRELDEMVRSLAPAPEREM